MAPMPTRFPASRHRNDTMVQMLAITSTSFPYLFAKTSGSVSARSSLMNLARKTLFSIRLSPRPSGSTAPSQKWYLYDSVAAPRMALESMDCEARVAVTTQRGSERPATKKFSLLPLMTRTEAKPTTTKRAMASITAMPNPLAGGGTSSAQGSAHTVFWQQESSGTVNSVLVVSPFRSCAHCAFMSLSPKHCPTAARRRDRPRMAVRRRFMIGRGSRRVGCGGGRRIRSLFRGLL
mmetsp:Transcript_47116/g.100188  ORF Transcript_47116/g.100188 Transcript_47116/m.100188 type:complete len:235 (-) Transcript_47116:202-906(-)